MNNQNTAVKIIGPLVGLIILVYMINLGVNQLSRDRAAMSQDVIAVAAAAEAMAAGEVITITATDEEAETASEADAETSAETTDGETAAAETDAEAESAEATATEEAAGTDTAAAPESETVAAAANNGDPTTIEVQMGDLFFGEANTNLTDPPIWTAGSGQDVNLTLNNIGSVQHNWAVVKLDTEIPIPLLEADAADILLYDPGLQDAGNTLETTFTAPETAGEYMVICTAPGHYPLMQGRLVVE